MFLTRRSSDFMRRFQCKQTQKQSTNNSFFFPRPFKTFQPSNFVTKSFHFPTSTINFSTPSYSLTQNLSFFSHKYSTTNTTPPTSSTPIDFKSLNLEANKLAFVGEERLAQDNYQGAVADLQKALELKTKAYEGLNRTSRLNKDTSRTRAALAFALQSLGKLTDAEVHYRIVISVLEGDGEERINYAKTLLNFSDLLVHLEKTEEAEKYCEIAVPILGEAFPDHEFYAAALANHGTILAAANKINEAIESIQKALYIFKRVLGRENDNTISCVRIFARLLADCGRNEEREKLLEEWSDYANAIEIDDMKTSEKTEKKEGEEGEDDESEVQEEFDPATMNPEFQKLHNMTEGVSNSFSEESIDIKLAQFEKIMEKKMQDKTNASSSAASSTSTPPPSTPPPSAPSSPSSVEKAKINQTKLERLVNINKNQVKSPLTSSMPDFGPNTASITKDPSELNEPVKRWLEQVSKPAVDTSEVENINTKEFDPNFIQEMSSFLERMKDVDMKNPEEMERFAPNVQHYVEKIQTTLKKSGQKVPDIKMKEGMNYSDMVNILEEVLPATDMKMEFDPADINMSSQDSFDSNLQNMFKQLKNDPNAKKD